MDFKDLAILNVLYEEKNIKKAADRLFLSQPAISYRIQQLEKELGTIILIRGNKGVQFTDQGEYLVEHSKKLLMETEKMIEGLQSMNEEIQGTLKLGVSNNFSLYKLPAMLSSFMTSFPKVKIQLKTGLGHEVMRLLHEGDIHIGIESAGYRWTEQKILIDKDNLCLISRDPVTIDDLPNLPFIYVPISAIKDVMNRWWIKRFSAPPHIIMETDYVETCKRMVLSGLGVAFVPAFCLNPQDPLHVIDLNTLSGDQLHMQSWMNYRESSMNLSIVRAFVEFVMRA